MKQDEILQAAKDAGFNYPYAFVLQNEIERFAAIIEKRTIERCAAVCVGQNNRFRVCRNGVAAYGTMECAAAIRKLGEQE